MAEKTATPKLVFQFGMTRIPSVEKTFEFLSVKLETRIENRLGQFDRPENWLRNVTITGSTGTSEDCKDIWGVKTEVKGNLADTDLSKNLAKFNKKLKKLQDESPMPNTFGQYVWLIANALDIKYVHFLSAMHDTGYVEFDLKAGTAEIDRYLKQENPNLVGGYSPAELY